MLRYEEFFSPALTTSEPLFSKSDRASEALVTGREQLIVARHVKKQVS